MATKRRRIPSYEGDSLIPIMNLVCMLIPLLLYGAVFIRFSTLNVWSEKYGQGKAETEDLLNLTVFITDQGFYLKGNPKYRRYWMQKKNEGASLFADIPKKDNDWNFIELNEKLKQIKSDHSLETRIYIGAEDNIEYDIIIKTMDYSRGTIKQPLFPDVTLTRGVAS